MKGLYAFLGGALVGACAAALLTPASGKDLRCKIKDVLRKYGVVKETEEEAIIDQIVAEIEAINEK